MGRLLDVLRCILLCGEDDEHFDGWNARRTRSSSGYDGYYYRAEDSQVPSPMPSKSSTARPTQPSSTGSPSSSLSSKVAASSSYSRASPSSPLSSKVPTASALPSRLATSSQSPSPIVKLQLPSSNPSEPSPKAPPSSSLPSKRSAAGPLPSTPLNARALTVLVDSDKLSSLKASSLSSKHSPSSSPMSFKFSPACPPPSKASPFSPPSQLPEPGRRPPERPRFKEKDTPTRYDIPEHLQELIKNDVVPQVLKMPLSPQNYADYFSTLLYAEDYEIEKWSKFLLSEVTLELRPKPKFFNTQNSRQTRRTKGNQNDEDPFVAFKVDAVPEKRPYLLSRDYVFVQPSGQKNTEPFKGVIFRVEKSTVLVEFGRDFHKQHLPMKKYDVSFSFNRVCLKRSHVAVSAATDPLLCKILFPNPGPRTNSSSSPICAVPLTIRSSTKSHVMKRILNLEGLVPYLIEGPLVDYQSGDLGVDQSGDLNVTGAIIQEAILQIYRTSFDCKILVCAPRNRTCDALMRSLFNVIPKMKLFRANAAFRGLDLVPDDIMPRCLFEGECFTCPLLSELQQFKVITSTFMSSFRLHNAGIEANHFTHIFLVDASSAMEPETTVALANLVSEKTVIIITGSLSDIPRFVRSGIARRKNGLRRSLFHRLLEREPYSNRDPMYFTHVSENQYKVI